MALAEVIGALVLLELLMGLICGNTSEMVGINLPVLLI